MKKLILVLFFVSLYLNAQVEHTYFSGIHLVTMDAVVKSNWKENHMYKLGAKTRDVLLRGENNAYYIIRYKNQ